MQSLNNFFWLSESKWLLAVKENNAVDTITEVVKYCWVYIYNCIKLSQLSQDTLLPYASTIKNLVTTSNVHEYLVWLAFSHKFFNTIGFAKEYVALKM